MNMRGRKFEVDRANGKIAGVCAGVANMTGWDVTIVRVGLVLLTLTIAFPWSLIAYAVAAFAGQRKRDGGYAPSLSASRSTPRSVSREETRERVRNMDLRMQAIETYVTSSNSQLAREIEELR
jgi:phage shock protein C